MKIKLKFDEGQRTIPLAFQDLNLVDGFEAGYNKGYAEGEEAGIITGKAEGETIGYNKGYAQGEVDGKAEGETIGYNNAVASLTELTVTENGRFTPSGDSIGFDMVVVNVPASGTTPVLQVKTVTPSASQQNVNPDTGYDGLSKVVVLGDANLLPENIKKGVTIFGVTGTYKEEPQIIIPVYTIEGSSDGCYDNCLWENSPIRDYFYSGDVNSITLSTSTGTDFVLGVDSDYLSYVTVTYGDQVSVNSYVTMSNSDLSYYLDLGTNPVYITAINVTLMDGWDDYAEHYGYPPSEEKIAEVQEAVLAALPELIMPRG